MVLRRSEDTDDSFITDLAGCAAAGQIKAGAPFRGECLTIYTIRFTVESFYAFCVHSWITTFVYFAFFLLSDGFYTHNLCIVLD
jgi:hypothetical protein